MKIQLIDEANNNAVIGSATFPAGTPAILLARFGGQAEMLTGLLTALNSVIDLCVDSYPPVDVQAARTAAATASATLAATAKAYRATQDTV